MAWHCKVVTEVLSMFSENECELKREKTPKKLEVFFPKLEEAAVFSGTDDVETHPREPLCDVWFNSLEEVVTNE